jgi:outer membrane receptor protein involved in Fe transport
MWCAFALGVVLALPAAAQQAGGAAIRGRVVDPQGQGVAAHVVATDAARGLTRDTQADADGRFVVAGLVPGEVVVTVDAPGFAEWRTSPIRLEVGQVAEVDATLSVAGVQEAVDVRAGAGTVDRITSVVGGVISADEIRTLPLNGRNFLELAFLTPGSAPAPTFDPTKAQSVIISSAGQLGRGGNITIDGMDDNDDVVGGPLQNIGEDAIQEFQVATNRFSAELGRSASSVINVVTKSGGSTMHGSAAIYLRDARWQALPATIDSDVAGKPPFSRQQGSGTWGGPILRDKLFGFAAIERRNQNGGVLVGTRDTAARSITYGFADAPLDEWLGTARADWRGSARDQVTVRYSGQDETDISASTLDRAIGSASQRQRSHTRIHAAFGAWTRTLSPRAVNALQVSWSDFDNGIVPVASAVQLTFPSLQDGSSFRVPQGTQQRRWQVSDALSLSRGAHDIKIGGQAQRVDADFELGVFRNGRVELVEDFPAFDRNGDGVVDDNDLLFQVTLRSGHPDQDVDIPDADNVHLAAYVQDDWRVTSRLSLNAGVRYEIDTDVNNISRVDQLNPIVLPFVKDQRRRDTNNVAPRIGVNWSAPDGRTSVRGGYGIYYDRIALQIESLERGLDGRALPIAVRAGNVFFVDENTGRVPPFAPSVSNPFGGFILPGEGASGINIIDPHLQNPKVQQFSIGVEREVGPRQVLRVDVVHNRGTDFLIGRTIGEVFNPVVDGPDRVVSLESSARTEYNGLLVEFERRMSGRYGFRGAYTLSKSWNFANDDQIPFGSGPIDPNDLEREWANTANDRRHRLVLSGTMDFGHGMRLAGLWTVSSGVPMDILLPDASSRIPSLPRNAGGRLFKTPAALNDYITSLNAAGGVNGEPLPLVSPSARFTDAFSSVDVRLSRTFAVGTMRIEALAEVFNLFNTTNILGTGTVNYSGFANALVRDSNDPKDPGYMTSSRFGTPVSTAGGFFGSGGPRALQLGARVQF